MSDPSSELKDMILKLVNNSEISSIKSVVLEILNVIKDENSSAKDLKDIVEKDPPLCAKLLRLANSAHFGFSKSIGDIQEAIVCIGFDAVKELAVNMKVCQLFLQEETVQGYSRQSLWKHCTAVAICSKMIYRREFRERGDDIYVAGLLHDIGIIVEDQFFQELFEQALLKSRDEKINLFMAERDTLKIDHAYIGKLIVEDWGFPNDLSQAIGLHHEPGSVAKKYQNIVITVFIADYICQREKIGFADAPFRNVNLYHSCLAKVGIKNKAIDIIVDELKTEIRKLEALDWFSQ